MKMGSRSALTWVMLLLGVACCGCSADHAIPGRICGTPIDPALTRPLVKTADDFHEFTRVDRIEAVTAPCVLISGRDPALEFRFSWDETRADLFYLATDTGAVSRISDPRRIRSPYDVVVGTDGAISATPCKTTGGNYFTLTLQLPQVRQQDRTHRKDIERFMRAYFPATLKTLGCGKGGQRQKTS
jgi:hypothetical protein